MWRRLQLRWKGGMELNWNEIFRESVNFHFRRILSRRFLTDYFVLLAAAAFLGNSVKEIEQSKRGRERLVTTNNLEYFWNLVFLFQSHIGKVSLGRLFVVIVGFIIVIIELYSSVAVAADLRCHGRGRRTKRGELVITESVSRCKLMIVRCN